MMGEEGMTGEEGMMEEDEMLGEAGILQVLYSKGLYTIWNFERQR
jgi:hypothetical protein